MKNMINYFEWPKRKLSTTAIRLDYQNPRLTDSGKKPSQPEIIDYLIKNEKVLELAKTIVSQGYFLNEQPIVCKEDDKFIVLEGNRRVAACKVLINPDLIKSKSSRAAIIKHLQGFDLNIISKLEVIISPSREAADIMIVNRHTGGSVVEKWDKTKQDRFLHNRFIGGESIDQMAEKFSMSKSEIKKALQRYNVFVEINKLDLENKLKSVLREEVKFSMTNVERVYDSKHGRDFLGIDFTNTGLVIKKLPLEEFKKRLKKVVEKIIGGEINSRTLNKEDEKRNYFANLLNSSEFNSSIIPDIKYHEKEKIVENEKDVDENEGEAPDSETPQGKRSIGLSVKLIQNNRNFSTGIQRIDEIFEELKSLSLKAHPNSIAVLLRSYIDMVTYQFLKKNNGITELLKKEGERIKKDNLKLIDLIKIYLNEVGVKQTKINDLELAKALKLKESVKKDFIPSLKIMLDFLSKEDFISEAKLKQSLKSYLSKDGKVDKIIGHDEFNLLVHNEYYKNDINELRSVWNKLEPILEYLINDIKKTA